MRRPRGAQEPTVRLEVEVELGRVRYVLIDDGAGGAVARPIRVLLLREEADVVALPDDDDGYLGDGVEPEFTAGLCGFK